MASYNNLSVLAYESEQLGKELDACQEDHGCSCYDCEDYICERNMNGKSDDPYDY